MRRLSHACILLFALALSGCIHARPPAPEDVVSHVDLDSKDTTQATGFVFFGDNGTGTPDQYNVANGVKAFCATQLCQFVALLGDNIYPSGVESADDPQLQEKFEKPYKDLNLRFYAALGNHDYRGNIQGEIDYTKKSKKWVMPSRYYRFQVREVAFFVIDSDEFDEVQAKWLDDALAASTAHWKVVYGHHPIWSYGWHGDTAVLKERLLPVLAKRKADFYLCGHEHDQQVLAAEGLIEVVSGGGGQELRGTKMGPRSLYAKQMHGFGHLLIDGSKARLVMTDTNGAELFSREFTK